MKIISIDKPLSIINYRMYAYNYNTYRIKTEKLKKHHEQYFLQLLIQANGQLYDKNKRCEKVDHAVLFTNSEHLSKVLGCSSRTIRNYNKRLCEAGIIKKIYHGQVRDYEIIFNEFLVPLKDRNNIHGYWPSYNKQPGAESFARYIQKEYMRKNLPSIKELQEHFNKQLIKTEKENLNIPESGIGLTLEVLKEKYSRAYICNIEDYLGLLSLFGYLKAGTDPANDLATGNKDKAKPFEVKKEKYVPSEKTLNPESAHQNILGKIKSGHMLAVLKSPCIEELKYVFSYILFSYSLDKIPGWKDRIYQKVIEDTVLYIAENYFKECRSRAELDKSLAVYQKAIDISSRIIRKKLYSGQWSSLWVFPRTFFSLEYQNGFFKANQLLKQKQEERRKHTINKQRIEVNGKLNEILHGYFQNPGKDNYYKLLARVRDLIPGREEQFKYCIKNNIRRIENYYIKTPKTA